MVETRISAVFKTELWETKGFGKRRVLIGLRETSDPSDTQFSVPDGNSECRGGSLTNRYAGV